MPVTELNHYFVRANDLEKTKDFYCDVLGFEVMPRPSFPFPGYWLGVNGKIQVHMGPDGIDNADLYYLGTPKDAVTDHAGVVDHIAFLATEPGGFIRRFKERGVDFQPRSLPEFDLYQIFVKDPNGLTIELNFFGLKDVTDWGGEDYSKMPQVDRACGHEPSRRGAPAASPGSSYDEAMRRARGLVPGPARARRARRGRARDAEGDARGSASHRASSAFTSRGAGAAWSSTSWRCSTCRPRSPAAAPRRAGTSRTWACTTGCWRSTTSAPRTRCGARTPTR